MMFSKKKIAAIVVCCLFAVVAVCFAPVIPIRAEIASGQTVLNPACQQILSYGNFSVAFTLDNFALGLAAGGGMLNITAEHFTVTAHTETRLNQTTVDLTIQLTNVHAMIPEAALSGSQQPQYGNPACFRLVVGSATLNVDVAMQGKYVSYAFYGNSVSSVADLIGSVLSNL